MSHVITGEVCDTGDELFDQCHQPAMATPPRMTTKADAPLRLFRMPWCHLAPVNGSLLVGRLLSSTGPDGSS
jgi:hypothetical protein